MLPVTSRAAPRAELADPLNRRVATITGAESSVEATASSALRVCDVPDLAHEIGHSLYVRL